MWEEDRGTLATMAISGLAEVITMGTTAVTISLTSSGEDFAEAVPTVADFMGADTEVVTEDIARCRGPGFERRARVVFCGGAALAWGGSPFPRRKSGYR